MGRGDDIHHLYSRGCEIGLERRSGRRVRDGGRDQTRGGSWKTEIGLRTGEGETHWGLGGGRCGVLGG